MTHENKEQLTKWLRAATEVRGTLVRSIRFPDQTILREGAENEFSAKALELAWRVVSDTFHVLNAQRFPPDRLSWIYDRAVLHCVRRADGAMLGVFSARKASEVDGEGLNRLLNEFLGLALANSLES
ncbi:MAG TPA: hypothetical protein VFZ59_27690, partial [Verrucomicrobiae bacterium]|nr:hypothetical protein [Verrucomicrobiae bacterium]